MLNKIEERIIQVFSTSRYPGDDNIVPILDHLDLEREEIKELFKGKMWGEIDFEYLSNNYDGDKSACLNFMTEDGFRYYLPSYMLICIHNYDESDMLYDSLFEHLTKQTSYNNLFAERIEPLDDKAKKVIAEFIWMMHVLHGQHNVSPAFPISIEQKAFMSYWGDYYKPDYTELSATSSD